MKNITNLYNRWLRGELTHDQQHDLERSSLDDEMLYDAMEGIELYQKSPRATIEGQLSDRLLQHRAKRKSPVISLWPYAAAASLALVVGVYGVMRLGSDTTPTMDTITLEMEEEATTSQMAYDVVDEDVDVPRSEPTEGRIAAQSTPTSAPVDAPASALSTTEKPQANSAVKEVAMTQEMTSDKTEDAVATFSAAPAVEVDVAEVIKEDVQTDMAAAKDVEPRLSKKKTPAAMSLQANESGANEGIMSLRRAAPTEATQTLPVIGRLRMMEILEAHPFEKQYLFMHGIVLDDEETITFSVDTDGMPTDIDYGRVPKDHLNKLLKLIGPWPTSSERITFGLPVFIK